MKASLKTKKVEFLSELYPQFEPQLHLAEFIGTISIFSFFLKNEDLLNKNWEAITSTIATYYQSIFEEHGEDFERWNIYILFLVKGSVNNQVKYKIENDKFSSRKIIKDNIGNILNSDSITKLILGCVINNDLDISVIDNTNDSKNKLTYINDSTIYKLIKDSNLKNTGKGNINESIISLYQQILKEVEDEIQKS